MTTTIQTPELQASKFKPAQDFIHDYKLSQWRMSQYLDVLAELPTQGIMPTDQSIAQALGGKRTAGSVNAGIKSLVAVDLVSITGETLLGNSYALTKRGAMAVEQMRQIQTAWEAHCKSGEPESEDTEPNYKNSFHRLNSQIKAQQMTIDSQAQTIQYQLTIIESLQRELAQRDSASRNDPFAI